MPADVLEVTKKFMRDPIRILVKKEELTLEGIKQFYINVEREVGFSASIHLNAPFFLKHPAKTATVKALMPSSCGRVSMGTPRKESISTVSKVRLGRTSFLMSSIPWLKMLCNIAQWLPWNYNLLCWLSLGHYLLQFTYKHELCWPIPMYYLPGWPNWMHWAIPCFMAKSNLLVVFIVTRSGSWRRCVTFMRL